MKLGITGADGLIGWHIRAFAKAQELLADEAYLAECLRKMSMDARWADDIRLALRACETMPASPSN